MFWPPLGIGEPGIMEFGMDVVLVGKLLLAEARGASGAGPLVPGMIGMLCSAWNAEALLGDAGGSSQGSQSITSGCSRAPARGGVALQAVPPEYKGASWDQEASESMLHGCSGAFAGEGGAASSRSPIHDLTTEARPARNERAPRIEAIPGTNDSGKFCLSNLSS